MKDNCSCNSKYFFQDVIKSNLYRGRQDPTMILLLISALRLGYELSIFFCNDFDCLYGKFHL